MKSILACIALVGALSLSSCALPPPPPRGGGGRPVARVVVSRPLSPKPKKQIREAPPRLAYANMPSRRGESGRPGPARR